MLIIDGGPAYPTSRYEKHNQMQSDGAFRMVSVKVDHAGMTLRDYIATHALGHLISGRDWSEIPDAGRAKIEAWAKAAYAVSDAMLVERQKGPQDDA